MVSRAHSSVIVNLFINIPIRDAWKNREGTETEKAKEAYVAKLIAVCPQPHYSPDL